jgi:N,N'-diacetyllegionaminate synthase
VSRWPGDRAVGAPGPALLVAEIGTNHDGDLARALALIDLAADAGADAVQFHSFRAACVTNGGAGDRREHRRRTELRTEWHAPLRDHATARGVVFLAVPFDAQRAALLAALGVAAVPVSPASLPELALLRTLGGFGRPILLGCGAAANGDIARALDALAEGAGAPSRRPPVVLVNVAGDAPDVSAIGRLDARHACAVGWSDRRPDAVLALGAVARGAVVVVKPFTDDRARRGPDHATSLDPPAFRATAAAVRQLEAALAGERAPSRAHGSGRRVVPIAKRPS